MNGLPYMPYAGGKSQQSIIQFGGIRYGQGGNSGELADSLNLSARQFPALSQRMARAAAGSYTAATAIFGKGKLCVVDGTKFLYDGVEKGEVSAGEKQIVSINTKIVIWPDKVYYDTEEDTFGSLGAKVTISANGAKFTTKTLEGDPGDGKKLEDLFKEGQSVEISGSSIDDNNKEIIIREVEGNTLTFYNDSFTEGTSTTEVTIERKVPDLAVICSAGNRVWGADEKDIWACALGDPLSWYVYDGLSTDSFTVAVGTDGPFTACCEYSSNVLFFKENKLHKIIGTSPKDYVMYTYNVPGVQEGSAKSVQVINEVLYYKGVDGVYAYNGGVPYLVSENFGTRRYDSARAGTDGQQYYISMRDTATEEWGLWTLNTSRAIWLKEDDTHALGFTSFDGDLLFLSGDGKTVYKTGQPDPEGYAEKWEATFYPMGETIQGKKGYSKLYFRLELAPGAWVKAEVKEDFSPFRQVGIFHGERLRTTTLSILPGRCDTYQIRLSGVGRCILKSMIREFDIGSEV